MTKEEFIKEAIKNGHGDTGCGGWDWIMTNLAELDYIFLTEEYKKQDGYISKCMPFLIEKDELTDKEEDVLKTAWYLNNQRVHEQQETDKIKSFNDKGFFKIESDESLDGKKIEFIIDNSDGLFGGINQHKGKLYWSPIDERLMAMKSRCTRTGFWVDRKIYVKVLD